jgi:subtilisin family serine protease
VLDFALSFRVEVGFLLRTNGVTAQQAGCSAARPPAQVASLQGTSMATPLTAGSAALVRQYFLDGFYPSGAATPESAFHPSGVLVKAVILGAASRNSTHLHVRAARRSISV